jgi:putative ABC transport system permease protein
MTFTAVKSSLRRLDENYESYLEAQQLEDFYFSMGNLDINYLTGSTIIDLCEELDITFQCYYNLSFPNDPTYINNLNVIINQELKEHPEIYEEIIDGYADLFVEEYGYSYEKNYVVDFTVDEYAYKFISMTSDINVPYLVDGRFPENLNEVAIFPEFAEYNDLVIGDTITIKNNDYTITGFMYKPEFLFPIFSLSTIQFDAKTQTLLLATEETVRNLGENMFIKYLIDGSLEDIFPDYGYSNIQSNDFSFLGKYMQMVFVLMPADINFRVIALDAEITNATAFINAFLPLFVALVAMLLLVFMKRYIDRNKHDIKVLHALGYTKTEIGLSLSVYPFFVSLMVFVGYGLGLLLSNVFFQIYSARYLFPKADFHIYSDIFLIATVVPFVFLLLINYIFIQLSLRDKKRHTKRRLKISKLIENKTLVSTSILFFTISVLLVFGMNGNSMFDAFVDETKTGNHFTEMINLQYMTDEDHLDTYENYTKITGKIKEVNSRTLKTVKTTTIYGILPTSQLKRLINDEISNNLLLNDGVIVSDYLYTELDLKIGDTLTFEVGGITDTLPIMGVSNELIENNFYMSIDTLNGYFNLDSNYYNGLFTTDYNYDSPYTISRIDYNNSVEEMSSILNISSLIINYLVVLSVVLGLFIFTLILMNFFRDHRQEFAIFKSLGYENKEINFKYLTLLYILMVVLYALSVPVTNYILNFLLEAIMSTIGFKLIVSISIPYIIIGAIILHIIFAVTIYMANRYYDNIPMARILKHQDV